MKTNPLKDGALTENSAGLGTVTRKMVRERAVEAEVRAQLSTAGTLESDPEKEVLAILPHTTRTEV